jgi:hypothetical protein
MPHDLPQLIHALFKGVVAGAIIGLMISAIIIGWRWLRGERLFPQRRQQRLHKLPIGFWIFSVLFFGGFSAVMVATHNPSFAAFFGLVALLYASGLVYSLILRRRIGLTNR